MASPVPEQRFFSDVRQVGYLRKPKSMHKRFFVLRAATPAGPSRLEYYENEKKWRHKSGVPKRSILLDTCFNINKRADSKNKYLVALYTKDDSFSIAAESEQEQDVWYQALVDLHNRGKVPDVDPGDVGTEEENYGKATPGPAFKEVWQVVLKPKGLGHTKNLIGIYRLCLTNKTISFVKLNSDAAAVVLQLMNVRRCGHSENFFFIEVGRSAVTGPGEFWMQVDDSVVAQNMHETILEAMKAMSEEFRPRSKSQSSSNCSNPISVPLRRHHHHNNPPPSQVGLGRRRSRGDSVSATSPAAGPRHSQSFRVRASSDGEGTMSRPASVDGSPATAAAARTQSHRHRGGGAASAPLRLLHPPLNHSRSIPTPSSSSSSCCPSPSATSPVSLASSAHSSASDGPPFSGARCASGSPSDGGFLSSSDEYGSSPCDFRSSFRSVTPDSPGRHTPPAREEELNNYISMARHAGHSLPRGAAHHASCPDEPELEMCFRKLMHPSGTPPPPPPTTTAVCHQKTPSQSSLASLASLEEYTVMSPAHPGGRGESVGGGYGRQPACSAAARSYLEEEEEEEEEEGGRDIPIAEGNGSARRDDGYMPMSPGAAPPPAPAPAAGARADYVPMSPKSVSEPQLIINPRQRPRTDPLGYMMMSPGASCSPDSALNFAKIWSDGADASADAKEEALSCGDYMNMSPASCSTAGTPPPHDCYFNPVDEPPPPPTNAYFSLPRSFKHAAHRKSEQRSPRRLGSLPSGRPPAFGDGSSSSSASSDSLGGGGGGRLTVKAKRAAETTTEAKPARPGRLSLLEGGKASTLPRARDPAAPPLCPPEPKSPGEYVNIEFDDKAFAASLAALCAPAFPGGGLLGGGPAAALSSDYMNMQLERKGGAHTPPAHTPPARSDDYAIVDPAAPPSSSSSSSSSSVVRSESLCVGDYSNARTEASRPGLSDRQTTPSASVSDVVIAAAAAPYSVSSGEGEAPGAAGPGPLRCGLTGGPLPGLSAFTRVSWNQGARVVRADQQGRRRHSSETFSSTPRSKGAGGGGGGATPVGAAEEVKRHSSASFESVWLKPAESPAAGGKTESSARADSQNQNGLNYIDLDLSRDTPPLDRGSGHAHREDKGSSSAEDLSAYARISFHNADDLWGKPSYREE